MMREISTPVLVESKKATGRRSTCSCTSRRISVIARCAAMPRTCESAKPVTACTSVAAPAASASGHSRSPRDLPITSSMRTLEVAGSTSPASRLIGIRDKPTARRPLRAQIRSRASRQTTVHDGFFFAGASLSVVRVPVCLALRSALKPP